MNDCYIDLRQTTASRQACLKDIYRFTCTCPACHIIEDFESDDNDIFLLQQKQQQQQVVEDSRRARAAEFDDRIVDAVSNDGTETALAIAHDAVRLLSAKECLKWSIRYLADAHMSVYQLELACGTSERKAKKHLQAAHDLNILLTSERSPESKSTAMKLGIKSET